MRRRQERVPANRGIVLLGSLGCALTIAVATSASVASHGPTLWTVLGPCGLALLCGLALRSWRLVRLHGFFHDAAEDEDEDGSPPDGGSGRRFPPDAPDGGGAGMFDWDAFLTGFWDYVDSLAAEPGRELASHTMVRSGASASSGPSGRRSR